MPEERLLDLDKISLWVFEPKVFHLAVASIISDIRKGKRFNAVPVYYMGDNNYSLVPGYRDEIEPCFVDGGHHRAAGHFVERVPLRCKLVWGKEEARLVRKYSKIPISEVFVTDDPDFYRGGLERVERFMHVKL